MSGVRHLKAADYLRVPWRNGGGVTAEIAVSPAGATLASGFDWRLSCAEVASTGPFSTFTGYDRILVQLSGPPMQLVGTSTTTLRIGEAHAFSGEDEILGVVSEPVRDFNCIVRRGLYRAQVDTLRLAAGGQCDVHLDADTVAVFVASGAAEAKTGGTAYRLAPMDTLLIETPASHLLFLKASGAPCVILLVRAAEVDQT